MSRIEELEKQITELDERKVALQHELEVEKQKTVIDYPFEESEEYWGLDIDGELIFDRWIGCKYDEDCFEVGNMFKTAQEAKKNAINVFYSHDSDSLEISVMVIGNHN